MGYLSKIVLIEYYQNFEDMLSMRFNKLFICRLLLKCIIRHEQAFKTPLAQAAPRPTTPADLLAPS
jgi:hypothetical protein